MISCPYHPYPLHKAKQPFVDHVILFQIPNTESTTGHNKGKGPRMTQVSEWGRGALYITFAWLPAPKCAMGKLMVHKREENGKVTEAHKDPADALARRQTTPKAAGPRAAAEANGPLSLFPRGTLVPRG